jgi:hypothetical protein
MAFIVLIFVELPIAKGRYVEIYIHRVWTKSVKKYG